MKKFLAMLLALTMVLSLAACGGNGAAETTAAPESPETTAAPVETEAAVAENGFSVDYAANTVQAGSVTININENAGGGEVGYDVYAGIEGKDYTDPETYTMNDYLAGTSNMKWAPHTWETSDDSYVLDYISTGFFGFNLNSTADGWAISFELVNAMPEDVTAEYVGQFGIAEGETGKAWKFVLNENACWEDGTPINADSYMYSYKELLDPQMLNRRADSLYAGDVAVYNAKNYFYQGRTVHTDNGANACYQIADLVKAEDGTYTTADGAPVYIGVNFPLAWTSGNTLNDYVAAYGEAYFDVTNWETLMGMADENGLIALTDEALALFTPVVTGNPAWGETDADLFNYLVYDVVYGDMAWEEVGMIKTGDYELVFVTEKPIENANYYLPYNFSSTYLVYEPLWESCKSYFDADGNTVTADAENIASITTNYGTSVETTMSYGPYKLTTFELDKQIKFERNENWFGYSDGKHLGQYQTDIIDCQIIADQSTALLAFLNGDLDSVSLRSEDMATYGTSDYIRYNPQSYTTKLSFNTNLESLAERGTQILANANFRKAFALSIDRTHFATAYTSAGSAGYGLLNYMYVYDPYTGATYRDTDGAKDALVQLYGLSYGEDGEYGDLDEAYEAITGYDIEAAKALMAVAYDECVAAGYYDGTSEIKIQFNVYNSEDIYVQMTNYLNDALAAACAGTGFEGKVSINMVVDADYYETNYSGGTDMIFTTWGGAAYSPYTMLYQCYCDAADGSGNQMEYGFDTSLIKVTIQINGKNYTTSLQNWALWANGDLEVAITADDGSETLASFNTYDAKSRSDLFSKMEYAYLSFFTTTPVYYRNSALLVSQQGDYAVQQYVDLIGFAGTQFYTYSYTDAEWETYAAAGLTY